VLVLTGAGEQAFCAGADLKAIDTLDPDAPGGPLGFTRLASPKPTIAAVSGWCLAGGFELALWCDLRVATEDARFGFAERRWGVPLIDGGTQRLPRIVGLGRALDLVLSGRTVEAAEAQAIGLVTEVVPGGARAVARALEMAEGLAAFPQDTMLSDRRALLEGAGLPLADGLAREAALGREVLATALEGAARFAGGAGRAGSGTGV
jgi:enoyl-CoA hydratase